MESFQMTSFRKLLSALILSLPLLAQSTEPTTSLLDTGEVWHHQIEIITQKPARQTFPLLIFLHGATERGAGGIAPKHFQYWVDKGYAIAAISMPGYGRSTGRKDYCGPFTMRSVHKALDAIKTQMGVSEFGLVGFGLGSTAALLSAADRNDVACVLSANGCYDLVPHLNPDDLLTRRFIDWNYDVEIDLANYTLRSPIERLEEIDCPVLVLHRENNPYVSRQEAIRFVDALVQAGKEAGVSILPKPTDLPSEYEIKISYGEILDAGEEWLDRQMKGE